MHVLVRFLGGFVEVGQQRVVVGFRVTFEKLVGQVVGRGTVARTAFLYVVKELLLLLYDSVRDLFVLNFDLNLY